MATKGCCAIPVTSKTDSTPFPNRSILILHVLDINYYNSNLDFPKRSAFKSNHKYQNQIDLTPDPIDPSI